jgi:predicted nucleotidyltransferase
VSGVYEVLRALAEANAKIVVIGGVALQLQGSAYLTRDIDFAYERSRENAARIAKTMAAFNPRPRGLPGDLPFIFDAQALMTSEVLTLTTSAGDVDFLARVKGLGSYREIEALAETLQFEQFQIRVLSIEGLILAKRAAGRPKDEPGLIELEAIREARALSQAQTDGRA